MSRTKLKEVVVVVTKDPMMKTPVTVFEHEVMILQEIHGEDAIEVREEYEVYAPDDFTAADEYERMLAKYGFRLQKNQPNPVVSVWGKGPSALANHLGVPVGRRVKRVLNESEQTVRDPRRVDAQGEDALVSSNASGMQTEDRTEVVSDVKDDGGKADTAKPTKAKTAAKAKPAAKKTSKAK